MSKLLGWRETGREQGVGKGYAGYRKGWVLVMMGDEWGKAWVGVTGCVSGRYCVGRRA